MRVFEYVFLSNVSFSMCLLVCMCLFPMCVCVWVFLSMYGMIISKRHEDHEAWELLGKMKQDDLFHPTLIRLHEGFLSYVATTTHTHTIRFQDNAFYASLIRLHEGFFPFASDNSTSTHADTPPDDEGN